MTRLIRKFQKIFGKNSEKNGQFGSGKIGTKITTTDPETIQALDAYELGWQEAIIGGKRLPTLEEMQGLNFNNTYQLAYLFQEGLPEWNSETTYYQNSWVKSGDAIYRSLIDDNTNNQLTDSSRWKVVIRNDNAEDLENIQEWSAGSYNAGDIVRKNNFAYYCDAPTTTKEPSVVSLEWKIIKDIKELARNDQPMLGGFSPLNNYKEASYNPIYKTGRYLVDGVSYFSFWLSIDGATYSDTELGGIVLANYKYKDLISTIGTGDRTLFDYRGLTSRAVNELSSLGIGQRQEDAYQGHYHEVKDELDRKITTAQGGIVNGISPTGGAAPAQSRYMEATLSMSDGINGEPRISIETRMMNFSQGVWGVNVLVPVNQVP